MAETERTTIIDPDDNDAIANIVESTDEVGIYCLIALNPDGSKFGE